MVSSLVGSSPVHPWTGVRDTYRRGPDSLEKFSMPRSGVLNQRTDAPKSDSEAISEEHVVQAVAVQIGLNICSRSAAGTSRNRLHVGLSAARAHAGIERCGC